MIDLPRRAMTHMPVGRRVAGKQENDGRTFEASTGWMINPGSDEKVFMNSRYC